MKGRIQAPKGTYDLLPGKAGGHWMIERLARQRFSAAGYRRIETPIIEHTELFARGVGAATDIVSKEMYSFQDAGERSLTLRPEGTAAVVRAYHEHGMHRDPQPAKLWYFGPFFRRERPQSGRYRQFWQLGAEAIGSVDPAVDAELIVLLAGLLDEVGVRDLRLRLGTLGSPERRADYRQLLTAYLRANQDRLADEVRARIESNPLRAFDSGHEGTRAVMASAPLLIDHLDASDLDHFAAVRARLDVAGIDYEIDPTLVRGLDYYTRTLFEFTSAALGAQSGVGGGGRYDRLAEQLGLKPTAGVGFAAGIERMLLAGELPQGPAEAPPTVDLYVAGCTLTAFALATKARSAGLSTRLELAGRSRKGMMKNAARDGAAWVALPQENGEVTVRDMDTGEERTMTADAVPAYVVTARRQL